METVEEGLVTMVTVEEGLVTIVRARGGASYLATAPQCSVQ